MINIHYYHKLEYNKQLKIGYYLMKSLIDIYLFKLEFIIVEWNHRYFLSILHWDDELILKSFDWFEFCFRFETATSLRRQWRRQTSTVGDVQVSNNRRLAPSRGFFFYFCVCYFNIRHSDCFLCARTSSAGRFSRYLTEFYY